MTTTYLVPPSSKRLVVMLEKALCANEFSRDGERLVKWGEVERKGLVGYGGLTEWIEEVGGVTKCM